MKKPKQYKYDNLTKNRIRDRVCLLNEEQLIKREYERNLKRASLVRDWMHAGTFGRIELRKHLDDCIRLVDFELSIIHDIMIRRGIKTYDDMLESEFESLKRDLENEFNEN